MKSNSLELLCSQSGILGTQLWWELIYMAVSLLVAPSAREISSLVHLDFSHSNHLLTFEANPWLALDVPKDLYSMSVNFSGQICLSLDLILSSCQSWYCLSQFFDSPVSLVDLMFKQFSLSNPVYLLILRFFVLLHCRLVPLILQ